MKITDSPEIRSQYQIQLGIGLAFAGRQQTRAIATITPSTGISAQRWTQGSAPHCVLSVGSSDAVLIEWSEL